MLQAYPAGQIEQDVCPGMLYWPSGQRIGAKSAKGHMYPGGQILHCVEPIRRYVPAAQTLKVKFPNCGLYAHAVPDGQG